MAFNVDTSFQSKRADSLRNKGHEATLQWCEPTFSPPSHFTYQRLGHWEILYSFLYLAYLLYNKSKSIAEKLELVKKKKNVS